MRKSILLTKVTMSIFFVVPSFAAEMLEEEEGTPFIDAAMAVSIPIGLWGPDLEATEKSPYVEYSNDAPDWCTVTAGANFGGKCKNSRCKANYVYIKVGKVEYLIRQGKYCHPSKCPLCNEDVEVKDWAFSNCCFKINAQKVIDDKIIDCSWKRADDKLYKIRSEELGQVEYQAVKVLYMGPKDKLPVVERI